MTNALHGELIVGERRDLDGKVLFLAGVGPQMGTATALIAAREGAKVALAARTSKVPEEVAAKIRATGGAAIALQCDLTNESSLRAAILATNEALGPIDCVFCNAGFYDNEHSSIEIDPALWQLTIDVNFNGALLLANLPRPQLSPDRSSIWMVACSHERRGLRIQLSMNRRQCGVQKKHLSDSCRKILKCDRGKQRWNDVRT